MNKNTKGNTANSSGIGFASLLAIVFITLKLLGKITWSWVWVLSPIWVSALLTVVIFVAIYIVISIKDDAKK